MSPMTKLSRALEDVAQAKDALRSAIEAKERVEEQLTLRTKELHAERARADMMSEVADKLFDVIAVMKSTRDLRQFLRHRSPRRP